MWKALAWKEFRELLPVVVPALLIQLLVVCVAIGLRLGMLSSPVAWIAGDEQVIPFILDYLALFMFVVGGVCAVAIGLWQTMWEANQGTFLFLLHRPLSRQRILGVKLVVGSLLSLLVTVAPILWYALWAATPGTHASPFAASMACWAWQFCTFILLGYLAAFLSGLRPAIWYGSRFFPVFAAALVSVPMAIALLSTGSVPFSWLWIVCLAITVALAAAFLWAILHVGTARDFS